MIERIPLLLLSLIVSWSTQAQPDCLPTSVLEPLDTWQTVTGNYDVDGWMIYEVTFYLGVDYVFKTGCGDGATADHNTVIEWMTPVCTLINSNDDGCEDGRSLLSFNSFFDEMVLWIRVRGTAGQGGSFTMAYRTIGGVPGDCNDCPSYDEQLAPSSLWQTVEAGYGASGCKVYRIFTTPGIEYEFKTGCGDGATADHNTQLEVFRNGCLEVTADDDGCEMGRSRVIWTAAASGSSINYVKVTSATGTAGSFTLAYRQAGGNGSNCGVCNVHDASLSPGTSWSIQTSSYLPTGCRIYRIASPIVGYQYTFKTGCGDGASADHDTRLELYDADCNLLAEDDDGCGNGASILQYTVTSPGILYLRVSGSGGANGFFTLATRRTGICVTCPVFDAEITPTMNWQTSSGSYFINGCWIYKVNVSEGHTYVFETAPGNGGVADHLTDLQVLQGDCGPVALPPWGWNQQNGNASHLASAGGLVYVKVSAASGAFGSHTMAYRDIGPSHDACDDVTPITLGWGTSVQLAGTLQNATSNGDFVPSSPLQGQPVEWYAFDISDGCISLIVSYCEQDPAWLNTLNILTTNCPGDATIPGTTPWEICTDGNAGHFFGNITPGLYYLPLLYDPANSLGGEYVISVTCSDIIVEGMEDRTGSAWSLYPNPGSDGVWLHKLSGGHAEAQVRIHDALGAMVHLSRINASPAQVDTGVLQPGIYFVEVLDGVQCGAFRWVKQ